MYSLAEARRAMREVGLIEGLPPKELCKNLEIGTRLGDSGQGILAFFLTDMHVRGTHVHHGCASTIQFAEMRLEIDRRRAGELLRVGYEYGCRSAPIVRAILEERAPARAGEGDWSRMVRWLKDHSPFAAFRKSG